MTAIDETGRLIRDIPDLPRHRTTKCWLCGVEHRVNSGQPRKNCRECPPPLSAFDEKVWALVGLEGRKPAEAAEILGVDTSKIYRSRAKRLKLAAYKRKLDCDRVVAGGER